MYVHYIIMLVFGPSVDTSNVVSIVLDVFTPQSLNSMLNRIKSLLVSSIKTDICNSTQNRQTAGCVLSNIDKSR